MKIAILGKGTSSIITALTCILRGHTVEIYYDPNTDYIRVGESTTPHIGGLIYDSLGISVGDLVDCGVASYKNGIKFIDWGNGLPFNHHFANSTIAFHFENTTFNPLINDVLMQCGVKYIPQRVDNYVVENQKVYIDQNEYDFLISCVGWDSDDEYLKPFFESVNSAILYRQEGVDEDFTHTIHKATEDGWQFGLPFPKSNVTKCGYLFNNKYTTADEVKQKLSAYEIYDEFNWNPKYLKKIIKNDCVASNGNRLFFFEPLQALTLAHTNFFARIICDYLDDRTFKNMVKCNQEYIDYIFSYLHSIACHYRYGSIYNSKFWDDKTNEANEVVKCTPNGDLKMFEENIQIDMKFKDTDYCKVGIFNHMDLKYIHYGMTKQ
jgi:hypothetical protein